ncbi:hypothetical protein [Actinomadura sp. 7K534]|uniref:hypothetical protein n=1 Tax=Actinomadura sp. 7K534 TaxID=2530366 RepID=UPI001FB7EE1D|nr:hypothetical protein [Actinomadura sp. 7K534]
MSNGVVLESADTLHGQLQRGLGRAARRAADRRGAGEFVYDCVRRDPRWDHQCESRRLYYARLMVDLEMPAGPVAAHLFDPSDLLDGDDWRVDLALGVLADLVRLSRREAAVPLRRYAEEGAHWFDAVEELIVLGDPSLTAGLEDSVAARCDDADLEMLIPAQPNPVIETWAARQPRIADALTRRREAGRAVRRTVVTASGRERRSEEELLEVARGRGEGALAAIFELGRRRTLALLDLAEELLPREGQDPGPSRFGSAVRRALREYGPETLPRARVWAAERGGRAELGLSILARYGTRQDVPLLMDELRTSLEGREWRAVANPVVGLGRLRAGEAVPLLKAVWTESPYAYLRPRILTALTRTAPHTAEAYTIEGLWDCEEGARQEAARSVPLTRETRIRLQRLHHDPAEETDVRTAAGTRLMT